MPRRYVLAFVLLFASSAIAQTMPADAEAERKSEKARIEAEVATLPVLRIDSIEQAVKLSVESEMLDARTSLKPQERESLLIIPDVNGVVRLTLFGPKPAEFGGGDFFDFLQRDLTNPVLGQVYTRVASYAGRVSITQDSENGDWFTSVQLIQDAPPQPDQPLNELPVRLYIHRYHFEDKVPPKRFTLAAASFLLLRMSHIPEVDQYLRPVLRDLHQERNLLAIPDSVAWLALRFAAPQDPQMLAKVTPLVAQLDSPNFQDRRAAAEQLMAVGETVLVTLTSLDKSKLSAQQQSEIAAIVEELSPLSQDELRILADNKSFLIDVLYTGDPQLRKAAIDRLSKLTERPIELPAATNRRDHDQAIARLRDQFLPPSTQPAP